MQRDFSQTLVDLDDRPIALELNEDGTLKTPATLGNVVKMALMAPNMVNGQAEPASGMDALTIFDLSLRIHRASEPIEVTAEETTLMKERVAKFFTQPFVVGQALRMLEA